MKRILLFCGLVLLLAGSAEAALTYGLTAYQRIRGSDLSRTPADFFYQFVNEVEGRLSGTTGFTGANLYVVPQSATPSETDEGRLYYDSDTDLLYFYANGSWVSCGAGTFTGGSITSDMTLSNGVDIYSSTTAAHTSSIGVRRGAAYVDAFRWTNDNTTPALVLGSATTSLGVTSTGLNVSTAGAVTGVTTLAMGGALTGVTTVNASGAATVGSVVLANGGIVSNDTDTEITLSENLEDLGFDFTADAVGLTSSTGVVTFGFGDVDAITGVGSIAMDAAASSISLAADGAGDDLTVAVTGAQDASLVVSSSGTAADALQVTTTAGGIDITNGGAAGEDTDILASNASVNVIARENDADAIVIATTGGGGTSESINIQNDQGTAESAIDIDATAGGIDVDWATGKNLALNGGQMIFTSNEAAAGAFTVTTNTGAAETIVLTNTQGNGEDAVNIDATAGGIDIDFATGKNMAINGGQFLFTSNEAAASAFSVVTNTGAAETIVLTNTQGNTAGAITATATAGGITLNASSGVVFTQGQTRKQKFDIASVVLDGTAPPTLVELGTDGQTQVNALSFDADGGATGDDIAFISWRVPDGYVVDSARLNVGYYFSTAEDAADEAQFDFTINAAGQNEALDAAGTALADQTTVIADASADNGNVHFSQYNIEVEDIAVDDLVTILISVDESASALTASGTLDVMYLEIEYESTE
jgi:hypothetical protein